MASLRLPFLWKKMQPFIGCGGHNAALERLRQGNYEFEDSLGYIPSSGLT